MPKRCECAEEGLEIARNLGDKWLIGNAMAALGTVATSPADKRALWQEAAAQLQRVGDLGRVLGLPGFTSCPRTRR